MRERIDESKNVQTTPTRTYRKCSRPLPYCNPNCRTPGTGSLPSTFAPPDHLKREKEERKDRGDKNVQTTPPASTASAVGPLPSIIQIVGHTGTGSLPRTIELPDYPRKNISNIYTFGPCTSFSLISSPCWSLDDGILAFE